MQKSGWTTETSEGNHSPMWKRAAFEMRKRSDIAQGPQEWHYSITQQISASPGVTLDLLQQKTRQIWGPVEPPVSVTDEALSWHHLLNLLQVRSCKTANRVCCLQRGRAAGNWLWEKEMSCTKAWESPTPSRGTPAITGGFRAFDCMREQISNKIRVKVLPLALLQPLDLAETHRPEPTSPKCPWDTDAMGKAAGVIVWGKGGR